MRPFQRLTADSPRPDDDSIGLGLSIVSAIVVAHDAKPSIRPRADGGLSVVVTSQFR